MRPFFEDTIDQTLNLDALDQTHLEEEDKTIDRMLPLEELTRDKNRQIDTEVYNAMPTESVAPKIEILEMIHPDLPPVA